VLNNVLRERNGQKMARLKPYLAYLMRGMSLLPPVTARVYRGVPGTSTALHIIRTKYQSGINIHWSAFNSTTRNLTKAQQFAQGQNGVIFRIDILYGRSVVNYSALPDEAEIVLSPNTKLAVTSELALAPDGFYYIDMIEMRDERFVY